MRVSVNWLKEFTKIGINNDELVRKIGSQLGEVEETIDLAKKYEGIVIARVVECKQHENADKLKVCQIDAGKGLVQVVCGAPNVREDELVAWIPPGKVVPTTFDKDPFTLESRKIRGELSNGMLASSAELDINDDHDGIVLLDRGKPGDDFAETYDLDDLIIDIENKMFTHRPDCFGLLGVAREIAGIQGKSFKSPDWYVEAPDTSSDKPPDNLKLSLKNELPKLVPRFMTQAVKGVDIEPSSLQMQIKLKKAGIKPINNIVDVTNYVMYLTGQPLHAYDYDKLAAISTKTPTITIRYPKKDEKIKLLNGKTILPHSKAIMIATDKELVGIGGVMGGANTEVDEKTVNIVLECANFDLYSVRRTSMIHGLFTDAVTRFSKGQSSLQNDRVLAYAVQLITSQFKNAVADQPKDSSGKLTEAKPITIDNKFINDRLGLSLTAEASIDLLRNVEFKADITRGSVLIIESPFWRTDIEIKEDIVEEIGRLYGYDNLPLELPKITAAPSIIDKELTVKQQVREHLAALGANEVLTYSFVRKSLLEAVGQDIGQAFKIKNALSPDLQYYRLSLTPSLIEKVHPNIKAGFNDFALFEIGRTHGKSEIDDDGIPKELGRLSAVVTGDYFQAKYFAEQLFEKDLAITYQYPTDTTLASHPMASAMLAPFSEKRSAVLFAGKQPLGIVGEFKPAVYKKFKLPKKCAGFELFLSGLSRFGANSNYAPLSRYPSIEHDITLVTDYTTKYSEISEALVKSLNQNSPKDIYIKVRCLDLFAKDEKTKNTTFRLTITSHERTLSDKVINIILDKVSVELQKTIHAKRI